MQGFPHNKLSTFSLQEDLPQDAQIYDVDL